MTTQMPDDRKMIPPPPAEHNPIPPAPYQDGQQQLRSEQMLVSPQRLTGFLYQMRMIISPQGLITLAIETAITLGIALTGALCVCLIIWRLFPSADLGPLVVVLIGGLLGGSISFSLSTLLTQALFAFPLTLYVLLVIALRLALRSRVKVDGTTHESRPTLARALVEGLVVGTVLSFLTAFANVQVSIASVQSRPLYTLIITTLLVAFASYGARTHVIGAGYGVLAQVLKEICALARVYIPLYGGLIMLCLVAVGFISGEWTSVPGSFLYLVNGTFILIALSYGGGISSHTFLDGYLTRDGTIFAWSVFSGWGVLFIVLGLVALVAGALAVGVRRERSITPVWGRTWQLPLAMFFLWFVGLLVVNVYVRLEGTEIVSTGMRGWTSLLIALVAMGISILAEYLPQYFATAVPGLLAVCAGRKVAHEWIQSPQTSTPLTQPAHVGPYQQGTDVHIPVPPPPSELVDMTAKDNRYASSSVAPMTPTQKKQVKLIFALVGVIIAIVIIGIGGVAFINSTRSPEAQVRRYLTLLADGHAAAATQMVDPGIPNEQRAFLTDEVLKSAGARLVIEDVQEEKTQSLLASTDDRHRVVRARILLDGQRFEHRFTVERKSNELLVFNRWGIQNALLAQLVFDADHVDHYSIGPVQGQIVSTQAWQRTSVMVYPGVYTVNPEQMSDYLTAQPVTAAAIPGDVSNTATVKLQGEYTQEIENAALAAIQAKVSSCGTAGTNRESGCPISVQIRDVEILQVEVSPTRIVEADSVRGVYKADKGSITIKPKGAREQRSVEATYTAKVKTNDDGSVKLNSNGQPEFTLTLSWF